MSIFLTISKQLGKKNEFLTSKMVKVDPRNRQTGSSVKIWPPPLLRNTLLLQRAFSFIRTEFFIFFFWEGIFIHMKIKMYLKLYAIKCIVFIIPGKIRTLFNHSIFHFFFLQLGGKKKFFYPIKFVSNWPAKKRISAKSGPKRYLEVSIFLKKSWKRFFFLEKFTLYSLTHFHRAGKKQQWKKTQLSLT